MEFANKELLDRLLEQKEEKIYHKDYDSEIFPIPVWRQNSQIKKLQSGATSFVKCHGSDICQENL